MTDHVLRVQSALTDRDHVLLGWLADHGVLTTAQIAHALFPSVDFAQERLRKLTTLGVLARFRPQRPEGGSYPYHYLLDQLGVDVVCTQREDDLPRRDAARKRRWHLTNRANLPHLLGINQFFIELAGHARTHPEARLVRWWPASRTQRMGAFAEPDDPVQVRAYTARVRPDGHGIWVEHDDQVPFFLEHDTGTERLSVLVDKITAYEKLAAVTRRVWPVLFWLHSATRERHLHQRLSEAKVRIPVATAARDEATHAGKSPAESVWWLHHHPGGLIRLAALADTVISEETKAA
ncbi:replication-relaxation family protein [Micromonospora sp. NPDC047793]|uniref:replication-relaxation family protein n=1 Tax=Micromonospora sp. NPDC047793 TaxID=3154342 RepID=UPI0033E57E80